MLIQSTNELRAMVAALATHEVTLGGVAVPVIFESPTSEVMAMVDSAVPRLVVVEADWPGVARGSSVTVGSATFTVIGVEPDGDGLLSVQLQK